MGPARTHRSRHRTALGLGARANLRRFRRGDPAARRIARRSSSSPSPPPRRATARPCCTVTSTSSRRSATGPTGSAPYDPVRRDDRLYARGVGDDGYSTFAALLAVEAMEAPRHPPRSLRRTHRSQRGERQPGPRGLPRRSEGAPGPGRTHDLSRLGRAHLRPAVGDLVTARGRERRPRDRGPRPGPTQRFGQRRRAVVVSDPSSVARSRRGRHDRRGTGPAR